MSNKFPFFKTVLPMMLLSIALTTAVCLSCKIKEPPPGNTGMAVTIMPQAEFAHSIVADNMDVTIMVPPGASPHTYEPTPSQMESLARAKLYAKVGSGVEFELSWMDKLAAINREMLIVDCSQGIELIPMTSGDDHEEEGHEEAEHEHEHGTLDPHIWMSPRNAVIMVRNMLDGLIGVDPAHEQLYRQNAETYIAELEQLDRDIASSLEPVRNRVFMVYHPAFGYLARDYGLIMLPVEEEGKEPTPAGLAHVISQARSNDIKVVFASPQFNPQSAEAIAKEIGGRVVFIDPLAENYSENLRALIEQMVEAME